MTHTPCVTDEPAWALEAKEHVYNAVVSKREETSVAQHLHEESAAPVLPIPLSTHQAQSPPASHTQDMPVCQSPDYLLLPVEVTLK
jgi:hypothetical protein